MPTLTPPLLEMFSAWLAPIREQIPPDLSADDAAKLQQAITEEAMRRFGVFLNGVKAYQRHPEHRSVGAGVRVAWEAGTTRLLDYAPESKGAPLFVIPSLVNRFEILDLEPDFSFLRFLAAAGLRPLVVDWGEPVEEEKGFSIADYMTRRLEPMLAFVQNETGQDKVHVLGYCMGGMFALALALRAPQVVRTLSLLASPWDFAAGVGGVPSSGTMMGVFFLQQAQLWEAYLEKVGILPPDFLQAVFTGFQPLQILQKYLRFASLDPASRAAKRFVLTEDWLNSGVPLAWPVAMECLRAWYAENEPGQLKWMVADSLVDPRRIQAPTYVLVPTRDRIVPPESGLPLAALIPGATLHQPAMGHIGLMTSDVAPQEVWKPLAIWLLSR